jgi:ornithine carbamoyltransferase
MNGASDGGHAMTKKRDFFSISSLSLEEAKHVLAVAAKMKAAPKGSQLGLLPGRAVAIVMEKASTRTRVSFEVGAAQLGAQPVVLGVQGSQLGRGEPIKDTARVLSRYCDLIVYRTFEHSRLVEMASAEAPVINALTDDGHPVQVLCDVFTIFETLGSIHGRRVAWVGDGSSNMARSFVEAARIFDFHLSMAAPEGYRPPADEIAAAGKHLTITSDPREAVKECSVINTDVWTSMGQEAESKRRLEAFAGYAVTEELCAKGAKDAIVLHCLPAHRGEEIDDETIEGRRSRVWDQAENRLHVQKALMAFLLGVA